MYPIRSRDFSTNDGTESLAQLFTHVTLHISRYGVGVPENTANYHQYLIRGKGEH